MTVALTLAAGPSKSMLTRRVSSSSSGQLSSLHQALSRGTWQCWKCCCGSAPTEICSQGPVTSQDSSSWLIAALGTSYLPVSDHSDCPTQNFEQRPQLAVCLHFIAMLLQHRSCDVQRTSKLRSIKGIIGPSTRQLSSCTPLARLSV